MDQQVIPYESISSARGHLDRELPSPGRISAWMQSHRPDRAHQGRSWFVILAVVCIGIAMLFEPAYFFGLAAAFIALAWWRRESARDGVFDVVIGAFALGMIALIGAVAYYFIMPIFM